MSEMYTKPHSARYRVTNELLAAVVGTRGQGPFNGLEYCGCTVLLERKPGVKEMIGRFKRRLIRWFEGALASYDRRIAVPGRSLVPGFHFSPARARR